MPPSVSRLMSEADTASEAPDDARKPEDGERKRQADATQGAAAPARKRAAKKSADKAVEEAVEKAAAKDKPKLTKTADRLAKLGLRSDIDLVLHLPMRYEDETTLTPIGELLPGGIAQTEGVVFDNEIAYRPRRQLVVKLEDHNGDQLHLRFLNFYGSQVTQMAIGKRLRVRGDVRGGFFGMEMVHPAVKVVEG
ncbi:ATP-dependent DNA helicase RecG, partial [Paraburkholderia sp. BR14262]